MGSYKVPQDVEADDKLLGPFSFRQFLYLGVVALAAAGAFGLYQMFPPLVVIPLPFIIFFGALALPLRKDQPMEIYLAAVLSFYLKPRKRIWQADGVEHLIQITAPKVAEPTRTKNLSQDEASRRLSYLSDVVDTGGWVIKNSISQNSSIHDDFMNEASSTEDMFEDNRVSNNINNMIALNDQRRKQQIISNMNTARDLSEFTDKTSDEIQTVAYSAQDYYDQAMKAAATFNSQTAQSEQTQNVSTNFQPESSNDPMLESLAQDLKFNPYPDSIRQSVVRPLSEQAISPPEQTPQVRPAQIPAIPELKIPPVAPPTQTPPPKPIEEKPNDDIIRLVSEGKDLSVETLARQANKIQKKEEEKKKKAQEGEMDEGVFISLR